jgi:hypothetical protein
MRHFLILFMFLVNSTLYAKVKPDDIIFISKTDSIFGHLVQSANEKSIFEITFLDKQGQKVTKTAQEIYGYKTVDGELFESQELTVNGTSQSYFCNKITEGYAELFTTYIDGNLSPFLKINQVPIAHIQKGKETNILNYLFRDCPEMTSTYIESKKPTSLKNLAVLVVEYANCSGKGYDNKVISGFPQNKLRISPGVLLGYEFAGLSNPKNDKFGNSAQPLFGINCEILFGNKFAVVPAIVFSKSDYHNTSTFALYPSFTLYEDIQLERIIYEMGFRYYLSNRSVSTYFGITPCISTGPKILLERKVQDDEGMQLSISDSEVDYFTLGLRGLFGIRYNIGKLNPFGEIRYSYEKVTPVASQTLDVYNMNGIQMIVGISF